MFKAISFLSSTLLCANLALAKTLKDACDDGMQDQKEKSKGTFFEVELAEKTLVPQTLQQLLVDYHKIFSALEGKLTRLEVRTDLIYMKLFRLEALKHDIHLLNNTLNIPIPTPTKLAEEFATRIEQMDPAELLVANYVFYTKFIQSTRAQNLQTCVHRFGIQENLELYSFPEYPISAQDTLKAFHEAYAKISLNHTTWYEMFTKARRFADWLKFLEVNAYLSRYVDQARRASDHPNYNNQLADFFNLILDRSKL